jgi:thiol-disulfide isomerase/thioredoxin
MKKFLLIVFVAFVSIQIQAQDKGIQFIHEDFTAALEKAKSEDKVIFVDAYTTWCGPCKWMAANVFPEKEVADFYNSNFVNLKLDMEKGEGKTFAKTYKVRAYPTLLFINKNGEVVHKALGGRPPAEFVSLGQQASNPETQVYSLKKRYEAGESDPTFLKNYSLALLNADMEGADEVANKYLDAQKDWSSPETMRYIFKTAKADATTKLFNEIQNNRSAYNDLLGEETVDGKFEGAAMNQLRAQKVGINDFAKIKEIYTSLFPKKGVQKAEAIQLQMYQYSNESADKKVFLSKAVDYMKKYKVSDENFLNSMAWAFYEKTDDVSYLKQACKWAKKSIKQNSSFYNNDTAAAVCYKLKQKKKALKYANKAIELAKKENSDYAETADLKKKIEALN